jgi:hypothetical protein
MYQIQHHRLVSNLALNLTADQASLIIARAYARESYDPVSDTFGAILPGYQQVRAPSEILKEDVQNQMMDFIRMGLNVGLSKPDVRHGLSEKTLISVMWGFSNFDALVKYVQSDPVDPASKDLAMLAKFKNRYGYPSAIQLILGRGYFGNTLIIQPDVLLASRYIDQELALNPKEGTRVALVRTRRDGDTWLNQHLSRTMKVYRGALVENLSSLLKGSATTDTDTFLSILPERKYTLSSLVASHIDALTSGSPDGRSLIIDGVPLEITSTDLDHAFTLAKNYKINVVVSILAPDTTMWSRFESRLIFDFDRATPLTNTPMDQVLHETSLFTGIKRGRFQYVFYSEEAGVRYATMDLIPDDNQPKNVVSSLFSRIRG